MQIIKLWWVAIFILGTSAQAARVIQSKNGKVMIDLEGDSVAANQSLFLLNAQNKKVALVKILQVKNGKAVAIITKGKSNGSEIVQTGGNTSAGNDESSYSAGSRNDKKAMYRAETKKASVVVNLMSNSMTTRQADDTLPTPNVEDVAMKGSSFGVTGVLDWPIGHQFSLRGTLGYEPFKAAGTAVRPSCGGATTTDCNADITYLSGGGFVRYDFMKAPLIFWVAGGGTLKFPMSKSTTALNPSDIKMTMTYGAAVGVDYFINPKYFVPVSIEQQYFLKSDTVDANIMILRGGFGMAL